MTDIASKWVLSLTPEQIRRTLSHYEDKMKSGMAVIGQALKGINRDKAWRADYDSFEDYCQKKMGISLSRAYQLINAEDIKTLLAGELIDNPEAKRVVEGMSEGQLRKMKEIPEGERKAVVLELMDSGEKLTASSLHSKAVKRGLPVKSTKRICPHCGKTI